MSALIEADNIFVREGRRFILREVSLSVGVHDFITVVGPNGAGKTTLLKCMLGFFKPTRGRIIRRSQLRVGYLPQKLAPDKVMPLCVERFLRLRRRIAPSVWASVVEETQMQDLLGTPLYALSGGQLQRALLARALLGEPQLLVLDEPAQNLDIAGQRQFYEVLERAHKTREVSVLMVSHDLHFVMSRTNLVVCLYHHVCCSGRPHAVAKEPEFVSLFGDDFGRLMSVYHHTHDHTQHEQDELNDDG